MHSGHFLCGLFWQQLSELSQLFNGWVLPGSPVLFLLLPESGTLDTHSCFSSACIIDAQAAARPHMLNFYICKNTPVVLIAGPKGTSGGKYRNTLILPLLLFSHKLAMTVCFNQVVANFMFAFFAEQVVYK